MKPRMKYYTKKCISGRKNVFLNENIITIQLYTRILAVVGVNIKPGF
jgi:hypothetical protein